MAWAQVVSGEHRTLGSTLVLQGRKQLKQACGLIKSNVCVDVYCFKARICQRNYWPDFYSFGSTYPPLGVEVI